MKRIVKRHPATAARLLVLLLLPAAFGCQIKAKELQGSTLSQVEQAGLPPKPDDGSPAKDRVVSLKDQSAKTSYSLGLDVGRTLQKDYPGMDKEPLLQGIRDGLLASKPLLTDAELERVRTAYIIQQTTVRAKELGPQAEKTLAEGEAFLRENAKKDGVTTLPSGLQYKVLKAGDGSIPGPKSNIKAHYVVRTIDGTELESTYKSEQPAIFPATGVIPAWTEAFRIMKEGDKWELFVPSYLAYGEKGIGKAIGPFQAVIFEIELLAIH